ncbi:MAG: hypothetical protein IM631_12315 [Cytophagales bacterium]|nr:hypothetical protein [Cytophagales bacterium]MCA6382299.1 hypothetical protein [Cytophagales bacterium]
MATFLQQLNTLRLTALAIILEIVKDEHFELFNAEEDDLDALYSLPIISDVSKHGFYEEYRIVSVSTDGVKAQPKDDGGSSKVMDFAFDDIETNNLLVLADLLASLNEARMPEILKSLEAKHGKAIELTVEKESNQGSDAGVRSVDDHDCSVLYGVDNNQ